MSALGMVGIVRIGSTTPARSIHLKSLRDSKA